MKFRIFASVMLSIIGFMPCQLHSQTFTEITTSIQALAGSSDWGDMDSDGDLDLLTSGATVPGPMNAHLNLYTNLGNGQFAFLVSLNLTGICNSNARWLDYNNDGILDIFASGLYYDTTWQQYLPTTRLYKCKGNKTFELTDNIFLDQSQAATDWGDFNNDGKPDIAISGYTEMFPNYHGKVYENMGDTLVESANFRINTLINGTLKWGDYDGDQDLDLVQTGWYYDFGTSQDVYGTYIYRNDVDSLTLLKGPDIMGITYGSAEWGDYDKDGDLDLLVSGSIGNGSSSTGFFGIYRNDGIDNFNRVAGDGLSVRVYGKSKWGDFDNDGDLDVLISGRSQNGPNGFTELYKNTNGEFSLFTTLCNVQATTLDFVDYDKDGDLDVFLMGSANYTVQTKLFKNTANKSNQKPDPPTGLKAEVYKNQVRLYWNPSNDDHTVSKSLSYNLAIGSLAGNADFMEPNSNLTTGYHKLVRPGNTSLDTCWNLNFTYTGKYFWKVQAIDDCFAGSAFSATGSFVVGSPYVFTEPASGITYYDADLNGKVNPFNLSTNVFFEYGTDSIHLTTTDAEIYQGDSMFNVKRHIQNLVHDTVYYYRIKAINEADTVSGLFVSFRTATDGIYENLREIFVYPNPCTGIIRLNLTGLPEGNIFIYDQSGRKRMELSSKELLNSKYIDISNFESGIYILECICNAYSFQCKIEKL